MNGARSSTNGWIETFRPRLERRHGDELTSADSRVYSMRPPTSRHGSRTELLRLIFDQHHTSKGRSDE